MLALNDVTLAEASVFIFAHVGIGSWLTQKWRKFFKIRPSLNLKWLIIGTLAPDLIDKPLYYAMSFWTGRTSSEMGLISGTRTWGHTLLVWAVLRLSVQRPWSQALTAGAISHLALDQARNILHWAYGDWTPPPDSPSFLADFFFPLLGWRFPFMPYHSFEQHAHSLNSVDLIAFEIVGMILAYLVWNNPGDELSR